MASENGPRAALKAAIVARDEIALRLAATKAAFHPESRIRPSTHGGR